MPLVYFVVLLVFTEALKDRPKVAFNAYTTTSGSYPKDKVIIFPNVLLNEGDGYNKDTGVFTAPVSGLYYFQAHVCQWPTVYITVSIVHDHHQLATTTIHESDTSSCGSVSAPVLVNVGENDFIMSTYANSKLQAGELRRWPSFSGFLVHD